MPAVEPAPECPLHDRQAPTSALPDRPSTPSESVEDNCTAARLRRRIGISRLRRNAVVFEIMVDRRQHWDAIYSTRASDELSWYQETPTLSLDLLARIGASPST